MTGLATVPTAAQATTPAPPAAAPAGAAAAAAGVAVVPFVTDVTAVGLGLAVAWNPSPTTEAVTGYTVTATPRTTAAVAGCTPVARTAPAPASDSQVVVTGLCAKVLYTVRMTATNTAGTSPETPAWSPVTPLVAQVPVAPAATAVTPRDGQALLAWAAPVDTGGTPVTSYQLTATPAGAAAGTAPTSSTTAPPDARTATLTGLTNGTAYTINVVAVSTVGASPAGTITVTPRAAYAPTAPTGLTATPGGNGTIAVSWAPPADNRGTDITGYTLTWQQATYTTKTTTWAPAAGAQLHTATVAPSTDPTAVLSYTVPAVGFEQPTAAYLFTVTATNTAGTSTPATTTGISPTVAVKKTTVVLTPASLTALAAADPTTLTWPNPAPTQITKLKVGQVLVADTTSPYAASGFLRTITAITPNGGAAGTNTVLTTTNAALTDAFTNAAVSTETNPAADTGAQPGAAHATTPAGAPSNVPGGTTAGAGKGAGRFAPAQAGVTVRPNATVGFGKSLTLAVDVSAGPVSVKGSVTIDAFVSLDVNLSTGAPGTPSGVRLTAAASVTAQAQLSASIKGEKSITLGYITGAPVVVLVGLVPVVIVPLVPIDLVLSGEVSLGVTAGVTVGASLTWDSHNPTKLIPKNLSKAPGLFGNPSGRTGTFTGAIGLAVKPSASIYALAGPQIDTELDLQADVNWLNPGPDDPFLKIGPAITLSVGLALRILGVEAEANATLSSVRYTAYTITTPPTAAYTITPSTPALAPGAALQLTATRTDAGTSKQTWTLLGGTTKDKVSSSGLFTAGPTIGRTLTATVRDTTGATGRVTITIGTPLDPPGNPTAVANTDGTATVTWTAPINTGGSPLASYTVLTIPDTGTHTIGAATTTVTLPGVTASAYVSIYATNIAGRRSVAATALVANRSQEVVTKVTNSGINTCALLSYGDIKCWGSNEWGQLGDGTYRDKYMPVTVLGINTATSVAASGMHTCARLSDETVRCWGYNASGQLGNGGRNYSLVPTTVANINDATSISVGSYHSCALLSDGHISCWGSNDQGQLGNGTNVDALAPTAVLGISTAISVAAGGDHTCALLVDHTVRCWGENGRGELGNGTFASSTTPVSVTGATNSTAISAGNEHVCALISDGSVDCWGSNQNGEIGNGSTNNTTVPTQVTGIGSATTISAGGQASCARLRDGRSACWGGNVVGTLGNGTTGNDATTPTFVLNINSAVDISVGGAACVTLAAGTIMCWGWNNHGQVGDGTLTDRDAPVDVIGLSSPH